MFVVVAVSERAPTHAGAATKRSNKYEPENGPELERPGLLLLSSSLSSSSLDPTSGYFAPPRTRLVLLDAAP